MSQKDQQHLLASLFPPCIKARECFLDNPLAILYGREISQSKNFSPARLSEFATSRHCARTALQDLGRPITEIAIGEHREPVWPSGIVGSITHCAGYRAAAVGYTRDVFSIGIDAESNSFLDKSVSDLFMSTFERRSIKQLALFHPSIIWEKVIFSAKESVYKTWYPVMKQWLDYNDCEIVIGEDIHIQETNPNVKMVTFIARLNPTFVTQRLSGHWSVLCTKDGSLIGTAIILEHSRSNFVTHPPTTTNTTNPDLL